MSGITSSNDAVLQKVAKVIAIEKMQAGGRDNLSPEQRRINNTEISRRYAAALRDLIDLKTEDIQRELSDDPQLLKDVLTLRQQARTARNIKNVGVAMLAAVVVTVASVAIISSAGFALPLLAIIGALLGGSIVGLATFITGVGYFSASRLFPQTDRIPEYRNSSSLRTRLRDLIVAQMGRSAPAIGPEILEPGPIGLLGPERPVLFIVPTLAGTKTYTLEQWVNSERSSIEKIKNTSPDQIDPIILAVVNGNVEALAKFTDAKLNAYPQDESSPLYLAIASNNTEVAKYLIEHGAKPSIAQLQLASEPQVGVACFKLILEQLNQPAVLNTVDASNTTILMRIINFSKIDYSKLDAPLKDEHADKVKALLDAGAKVSVTNNVGKTAISIAYSVNASQAIKDYLDAAYREENDGRPYVHEHNNNRPK